MNCICIYRVTSYFVSYPYFTFKQMPNRNHQVSDSDILLGLRETGMHRRQYEKILYNRYVSLIWTYSSKYGLTEDQGRQAYHDAILGFLKQIDQDRFRGDSSLYTYIRSIFIRRCIDIIRSDKDKIKHEQSLEHSLDIPDHSVNFLLRLITEEEIQHATQMLSKLGLKCRKILLLHAEGFNLKEISQQLGFKNVNSTYSSKHQCKKKLQKLIQTDFS